ncbi:MAG: hypothetical protein FJX23_04395 [Alphaproteobacteria bacterium]|nr:hypothetical protein [Alphaproteobacteria bacterium]
MTDLKFAHPIQWPSDQQLTQKYEKSINRSFSAGMTTAEAIGFLQEEVNALGGVKEAVLLTDFEDIDKPARTRRVGHDNAAVVRLKLANGTYRLACDRWVSVEQNIYALHLGLRNIRSNVGYGVGDLAKALGGYGTAAASGAAAPGGASGKSLEEWRLVLGLGHTATIDDAHAVYRRRAKAAANDQDELVRLNLAMDEAAKELGS